MLRAGRHAARRVYPGVGAREVLISIGAIMFAGGLVFGTVVAQRATPADGSWVATTGSTLPAIIPSTSRAPPSTTIGVPPAPMPGMPGAAGAPGPPGPAGPPGAPAPTVTVPPATSTTVGVTTTTRRCRPPPSHPHPTTTQKPCLPH